MNTRTLIIFSYWMAPDPAVGAKRFSFLAREFERQGYDVHVIAHASPEARRGQPDPSLPVAGHVHRCRAPLHLPLQGGGLWRRAVNFLLRRLSAPVGWEIFWAIAATRRARAVAHALPAGHLPGVIIATSPTYAALLAGARMARSLGWPLVLDYRDPWSAHEWPRWRRGVLAQWVARRIEARVVRHSAARVLNTPAMRASFEASFPLTAGPRNTVIPNGFDALAAAVPPPDSGPFLIVHAGEIFAGRTLLPVLRAASRLARLPNARPIRLITYGELPAPERARIRAESLEPFIEVRARIPFQELQSELQRAHLLLAVVGEHMPYSTPYKVYDYMAAGRPILALAPRGAALFDLLRDSGAGTCLERDDSAGIEAALQSFLEAGLEPARPRLERFLWSQLALEYRAVIESVTQAAACDTRPRKAPAGRSASAPSR